MTTFPKNAFQTRTWTPWYRRFVASLSRCSSCGGFVPPRASSCPHCDTLVGPGAGRVGRWLKAAGGASVAMTLMACYGVPYDPDDPTDTDPTSGTEGTAGATEQATAGSETAATDATEPSTGAAESTAGSDGSGSEGSDSGDGTGAGAAAAEPAALR